MIITGEFYNRSLISDSFYLKVLEKLWNEIINAHHVKIFNLLIVTCAEKITRNGLAATCKDYLDNLAKHIHSFGDCRDQQFLSNEIVKTMKLLMMRNQEFKKTAVGNPLTFFKNFLVTLSESNFKHVVQQIKSVFPVKKAEMAIIVDIYIKAATLSNQPELFVKFAEKIRNAGSIDAQNFTFKIQLEERLGGQIRKFLDDIDRMETASFKWSSMVGDLYLSNLVSIQLISITFQALFERESNNKKIVDMINILMKKVGPKMDEENDKLLDNYFKYFSLITKRENSYRTKIYKELMMLRWSDRENDVVFMEKLLVQVQMKNMVEITKIIGTKINESENNNLDDFINIMWKYIIVNHESEEIMKYAKLTEGLCLINENLNCALMQFMRQRNLTFCSIPLQKFSLPISKKLCSAIQFICYLYTIDVASEKDLEIWMRPNLVQHLTFMQNVDFSIKLGPKINESSNVNLKAFLTFVELNVKEHLSGIFNEVKRLLNDSTDI